MIYLLWFFALLGSQFYVFSSGLPQPAHMVLVIIFSVYIIKQGFQLRLEGNSAQLLMILLVFLFYTIVVNVVWVLVSQDVEYLRSSVFWIFSFLTFAFLLVGLEQRFVVISLKTASCLGVLILLLIWALGLGRYNYGFRFNAYFNDPNQMAFWVLCAFGIFFYTSAKGARYKVITFLAVCVFVVFTTASRSALLGVALSAMGAVIRFVGADAKDAFYGRVLYGGMALVLMPVMLYLLLTSDAGITIIDRFATTDFGEQADIRGYTRIINYPEYLLFGAGQGLDARFGSVHEIHSSWVALLFYYGAIGTGMFVLFIYHIFVRLDLSEKIVFMAPMLYGISTYGLRTPIFWFFLAAAVYAAGRNAFRESGA